MIPINDREETVSAKEKENETVPAGETASAEQCGETAAAAESGQEVPAEAEAAETAADPEEGMTGEGEENENCDGEAEEEAAEEEAAGKGGLKGSFLNRKQKKDDRKSDKVLEKLKKDLADKVNESAVLNDKYLRICAEYDNFRKRSQKEKDSLYGDIRSNVITDFLPVYDNLERALAAHTEDEAYAKGVEMIMNQFNKTLEKLGVEEIPALGETFDPTVHNAVMHTDDETKGENEVVEVFQKGFRIGDKIIRFAMVKVAN